MRAFVIVDRCELRNLVAEALKERGHEVHTETPSNLEYGVTDAVISDNTIILDVIASKNKGAVLVYVSEGLVEKEAFLRRFDAAVQKI